MKLVVPLVRNEIKHLCVSPATYLAGVLTLLLMGFMFFYAVVDAAANERETLPNQVYYSGFWLPVLLLVPMLTMKSFAEERRLRTLETLMTTPVRPGEVVLAKFIAAYLFYCIVWGLALLFPWITHQVIQQEEASRLLLDRGSLMGGLLFVCLSGMLFTAVGIFSSSLTRSQLVAGMLSFSIIFILMVGAGALRMINFDLGGTDSAVSGLFDYVQVFDHFEDFVRGVIDTRPFAYYLTGTFLVLALASLIVESKA